MRRNEQNTFLALCDAERAARREVRRWHALYSRKRPLIASLPTVVAERLHRRLKDEARAAEDRHRRADAKLDAEWARLSELLRPIGFDEHRAANRAISPDGWRAVVATNIQLSMSAAGCDVTVAEADWLGSLTSRFGDLPFDDAIAMIRDRRRA